MRRIVGGLVAALVGCAPGSIFYQRPPAQEPPDRPVPPRAMKTPEQWFEERWAGRHEDDVLLRFGKPHDVLPLSSGNRIYSYTWEAPVSTSGAYVGTYSGSATSVSRVVNCERRFELDKASGRVLRASIRGNNCNYAE